MQNVKSGFKDDSFCPCKSGQIYLNCCAPFHRGKLPDNALQLMRSRYSAYALGLSEYIIQTTHPENSQFLKDKNQWVKEIALFSQMTEFANLDILDFQETKDQAFVVFTVTLYQNRKDVSFKEKSYFEKVDERWLYKKGELTPS